MGEWLTLRNPHTDYVGPNSYGSRRDNYDRSTFFLWPIFGPLLFENETSDARDHCANERSMLLPPLSFYPNFFVGFMRYMGC